MRLFAFVSQIARRLPIDFPDDKTMRISYEAICQALFVQGRGALRRELADLAIMRRLDRLHLEYPFAGSRMLRGLLAPSGARSAAGMSRR
ncbi:hypothetical protein ABIB68_007401 [Bradyrhizobium sp. F1.2.2]